MTGRDHETAISRQGVEVDLGSPRAGLRWWWNVWRFWRRSLARLDLIDLQQGYGHGEDGDALDAVLKSLTLLVLFLILCCVVKP